MTIYKSSIRPHFIIIFDYDNVVYDRAFNELFHQGLESLQYSAAMSITGAIRGTSSVRIFQELETGTGTGNPKIKTLAEKIISGIN